ncbi:MAG: serine protease [Luteolibacter sp.]
MRINQAAILSVSLMLSPLHGAPAVHPIEVTPPFVVNDAALLSAIQRSIGKYAETKQGPSADDLSKQIKDVPEVLDIEFPKARANRNPDDSVYIISSVYLCGKCEHWHAGGIASAWALSRDGLMVTNYHVIASAKGGAMGVVGRDGKNHRVIEILAGDKSNDIAIIRVDSDQLVPLQVGPSAPIGEHVEVISNPDRRFFSHTYGRVSRYHSRPTKDDGKSTVKMSITADYAKGSSGGPVLDSEGRIAGMVASTFSIYYDSSPDGKSKQNLQMVIKDCVPVSAITDMFRTPSAER